MKNIKTYATTNIITRSHAVKQCLTETLFTFHYSLFIIL